LGSRTGGMGGIASVLRFDLDWVGSGCGMIPICCCSRVCWCWRNRMLSWLLSRANNIDINIISFEKPPLSAFFVGKLKGGTDF